MFAHSFGFVCTVIAFCFYLNVCIMSFHWAIIMLCIAWVWIVLPTANIFILSRRESIVTTNNIYDYSAVASVSFLHLCHRMICYLLRFYSLSLRRYLATWLWFERTLLFPGGDSRFESLTLHVLHHFISIFIFHKYISHSSDANNLVLWFRCNTEKHSNHHLRYFQWWTI